MESESKHTPTPWKAQGNSIFKEDVQHTGYAGRDCSIARVSPHGNFGRQQRYNKEDLANAKHIVHCVNSHDKLLDTIRNALTSLAIINMPIREGLGDVATDKDLLNIMADSFKVAIAKVEKGETQNEKPIHDNSQKNERDS